LPSFWMPSLTPDAKPTEIKKPVSIMNGMLCAEFHFSVCVGGGAFNFSLPELIQVHPKRNKSPNLAMIIILPPIPTPP
jgi:hypothetical protein